MSSRQERSLAAAVIELAYRLSGVGAGTGRRYATGRFLGTAVRALPAQLARALGWPAEIARAELDGLVTAGGAVRSQASTAPHLARGPERR